MADKPVEQLLEDLHKAEVAFARAYLEYRQEESVPGRFLSVDDAKANAVLFLEQEHIELPEVVRYRLHAALAIERSVEPS